ncbi:hypothetical protein POV27_19115 [Aureisphaera galaxeae]|nr:hypothetical protein [Aureisphaera galaxeae]MDC8006171.1 hypothetical protein [Aureisphaera galaxeae]
MTTVNQFSEKLTDNDQKVLKALYDLKERKTEQLKKHAKFAAWTVWHE